MHRCQQWEWSGWNFLDHARRFCNAARVVQTVQGKETSAVRCTGQTSEWWWHPRTWHKEMLYVSNYLMCRCSCLCSTCCTLWAARSQHRRWTCQTISELQHCPHSRNWPMRSWRETTTDYVKIFMRTLLPVLANTSRRIGIHVVLSVCYAGSADMLHLMSTPTIGWSLWIGDSRQLSILAALCRSFSVIWCIHLTACIRSGLNVTDKMKVHLRPVDAVQLQYFNILTPLKISFNYAHISGAVTNKKIVNIRENTPWVRFLMIELILSANRVTDMMLPCWTSSPDQTDQICGSQVPRRFVDSAINPEWREVGIL